MAPVSRLNPPARRHGHRGFTLIEILVTFAVLAVMLGLAAPSFIAYQRNAELTASANSFLAALSVARAEAMKRQLNAFVIPAADDNWSKGWTVFVDVNGNNDFDTGTDQIVSEQGPLSSTVAVTISTASNGFADGGDYYVMFAGSGFMRLKNGSFQSGALELTNGVESRRIIANPAGRFRICKPSDPGCNAVDPI